MERVGVRELRQNASLLLAKVQGGTTVEITNHGRPVARLEPVHSSPPDRRELIATGQLQPGRGELLEVEPVPLPDGSPDTSTLLDELARER